MNIDKSTVLYLFIIIGVGIGSFGLGRLSVSGIIDKNNNVLINEDISENYPKEQIVISNNTDIKQDILSTEKRYVASKNGKMYYSLGCSGAKRIKPENEVWFSTKEDAEKSGYTKSSTCK